ncbi:phage late control D family protein [Burkholderia thailandensis]|uniref:phage late control D family protein n=1 Tax=Burkholderia thailandensis TaxID=57975 RepID=UPI002359E53D|nr:phage late control D family protein [Burkholderia thailandensis]
MPTTGRSTATCIPCADGGLTSWQIGFSSALHFLRHRRDEHFWLDRDAQEILSEVFNRYPPLQGAFRFELSGALAKRSYCRQSETDWHFVNRIMEDEEPRLLDSRRTRAEDDAQDRRSRRGAAGSQSRSTSIEAMPATRSADSRNGQRCAS